MNVFFSHLVTYLPIHLLTIFCLSYAFQNNGYRTFLVFLCWRRLRLMHFQFVTHSVRQHSVVLCLQFGRSSSLIKELQLWLLQTFCQSFVCVLVSYCCYIHFDCLFVYSLSVSFLLVNYFAPMDILTLIYVKLHCLEHFKLGTNCLSELRHSGLLSLLIALLY